MDIVSTPPQARFPMRLLGFPLGDRTLLAASLLICAVLLAASIPGRSVWIDELFTVRVAGESSLSAVVQHAAQTERRPPLQYLALHSWNSLAGSGESSQRAFAALCLVLALPLIFALGKRLGGRSVGLVAASLAACSPFLVLYAPMVRAYSFSLLVGALATLTFFRWRERMETTSWLAYAISAVALAYTDYVGLALLAAQAAIVLAARGPQAGRRGLGLAWIVLAAAYTPWIGQILGQAERPSLPADFAQSLPGYALKIGYPLYSFAIGETLFPWHPAALAAMLALGVLAWPTFKHWRSRAPAAGSLVLLLAAPLAFTIFILSTFATDITFLNVPSRSALAAPFFYILLAGGVVHAGRWRWPLLAAIAIAWAFAIGNLISGSQYHNPIYAAPARAIAQEIAAAARPGEVVIADPDSVLSYYLPSVAGAAVLSSLDGATLDTLVKSPPQRVFLVTLGRDRTRDLEPLALLGWLDQRYRLADSKGYVPQDPLYSRLKERLLRRAAYQYKVLWRTYDSE